MRKNNELMKLVAGMSEFKPEGSTATRLSASSASGRTLAARSVLKAQSQSEMGLHSSDNAKISGTIRFGSPSRAAIPSTKDPSELGNLIKQSSSASLSGMFGDSLLGTLGGLGGLFSHVADWFGGSRAAEEPLTLFHLQEPRHNEISVGLDTAGISSGSAQTGGIYRVASTPALSTNQLNQGTDIQKQRAQILDTVRLALLNSSSLNDVIGEI